MRFQKLFGWGITIYAVMFLVESLFLTYRFVGGIFPPIAGIIVLTGLCFIASSSLRFSSWKDILPYSISWMIIAALLDGIFSYPYAGFSVYGNPSLLIGYALIVFIPLVIPHIKINH